MLRFETSKANFVAFKTLMSTLFETPVLFGIFTFHSELQNVSLNRERTKKKTSREANFERHYFICLHNKCMTGLRMDGRTDGRTYVRTDMTSSPNFQSFMGYYHFLLLMNATLRGPLARWRSSAMITIPIIQELESFIIILSSAKDKSLYRFIPYRSLSFPSLINSSIKL